MRVLVLTRQLPYPTGIGSATTVWSLVQTLLHRNHEVHLCCYGFEGSESEWWNGNGHSQALNGMREMKVKVHLLRTRPPVTGSLWQARVDLVRKALSPVTSDFYAGPLYSKELSVLLTDVTPDAICAWTVDAVAATANGLSSRIPRLALLTDLDHLARQFRRRYRPSQSLKGKLYECIDVLADRRLPTLISTLLSDCDAVVEFAAHHCEWLRDQGVTKAKYLPIPVLDEAGPDWYSLRRAARLGKRVLKISLIGNVSGIATLPGLQILASEILPQLEARADTDTFEVHVIGGGSLPPHLLKALNRPYVKMRGYLKDIHAEFCSSDILLVPTPIALGTRTRIAEGFSFGCCVVAHRANSLGMPELRDGQNVLLGDTGQQIAEAAVRCLNSFGLRERLGTEARATFEQKLEGRLVCEQIICDLERVVLTSR